jgi:hypothetical protein
MTLSLSLITGQVLIKSIVMDRRRGAESPVNYIGVMIMEQVLAIRQNISKLGLCDLRKLGAFLKLPFYPTTDDLVWLITITLKEKHGNMKSQTPISGSTSLISKIPKSMEPVTRETQDTPEVIEYTGKKRRIEERMHWEKLLDDCISRKKCPTKIIDIKIGIDVDLSPFVVVEAGIEHFGHMYRIEVSDKDDGWRKENTGYEVPIEVFEDLGKEVLNRVYRIFWDEEYSYQLTTDDLCQIISLMPRLSYVSIPYVRDIDVTCLGHLHTVDLMGSSNIGNMEALKNVYSLDLANYSGDLSFLSELGNVHTLNLESLSLRRIFPYVHSSLAHVECIYNDDPDEEYDALWDENEDNDDILNRLDTYVNSGNKRFQRPKRLRDSITGRLL